VGEEIIFEMQVSLHQEFHGRRGGPDIADSHAFSMLGAHHGACLDQPLRRRMGQSAKLHTRPSAITPTGTAALLERTNHQSCPSFSNPCLKAHNTKGPLLDDELARDIETEELNEFDRHRDDIQFITKSSYVKK
jgi:hypothetical protein